MTGLSTVKPGMLAACLLGLAACGGGSDTEETPATSNRAPMVNAGDAQTVDEFASVTLSGTASDTDGDSLTLTWVQTDGPVVAINDSATLSPSFDAPDVTAANSPEVLRFQLTADDGSMSRSDTVDITVNDVGLGANSPPTADAGGDTSTAELTTVILDGRNSSDPDGDAITYAWTQTDGPDVSLLNAGTAQPSFTAPDVAPGATIPLTFELTVSDGTDNATDTVVVSVSETLSLVTVAGRLTYERPTPNAGCEGYDFSDITAMPVRLATVLLLDGSNTELASGQTDDDGNYSFANVPANTDVRVRVRAELLQTSGQQTWEVYVRDNTSNTTVGFAQRPIYEVQWSLFNTGNTNSAGNDFTASTGWDLAAGRYDDNARFAAPLAILDSVLNGILLVTSVDADVDLGRLDMFWSINNSFVVGIDEPDESNGELVTAFYTSDPDGGARNPSLFLRGDAVGRFPESRINTDEFDSYVALHEWGHFFEDELSRSDSRGGFHQIPGKVDAVVAFGEGWGTAIGGIAGDRLGCDTQHPATSGSDLDVETYNDNPGEQGFYNEMSVATLIYDLWDTNNDGVDNGSIGFGPIYRTMTEFQNGTASMTTLFSFAAGLRQIVDPADLAFVDAQLSRENVDVSDVNIWATGQTTQPSTWRGGAAVNDLLPLYTELVPGGATENLCVNVETRVEDTHNNPGKWRYLYFTLPGNASPTLTIQANPVPDPTTDPPPAPGDPEIRDRADPDVYLYLNGEYQGDFVGGRSGVDDRETYAMGALSAGTYALEFHDWRHADDQRSSDYPERVCFDFTLN